MAPQNKNKIKNENIIINGPVATNDISEINNEDLNTPIIDSQQDPLLEYQMNLIAKRERILKQNRILDAKIGRAHV